MSKNLQRIPSLVPLLSLHSEILSVARLIFHIIYKTRFREESAERECIVYAYVCMCL